MACLDGRFLAHLSPGTVTGDDGRQQPDTSNHTAEAVAEVEPVPLVLRSDTVIYDAATQRPVDELLVTFHLAYHHISICQSLFAVCWSRVNTSSICVGRGRQSVGGRQLDDKSVV